MLDTDLVGTAGRCFFEQMHGFPVDMRRTAQNSRRIMMYDMYDSHNSGWTLEWTKLRRNPSLERVYFFHFFLCRNYSNADVFTCTLGMPSNFMLPVSAGLGKEMGAGSVSTTAPNVAWSPEIVPLILHRRFEGKHLQCTWNSFAQGLEILSKPHWNPCPERIDLFTED